MSFERVTVKEYGSVDEARAAEQSLLDAGMSEEVVNRSGKKIRVPAANEAEARHLLESSAATASTGLAASSPASEANVPPVNATTGAVTTPSATQPATSASGATQGAVSQTADTAKQAVSTATDTVQQTAAAATETVTQAASKTAETVQEAGSAAMETVSGAFGGVTSQVDQVTNALAQRIQSAATSVRQNLAKPDAAPIQRTVGETAAGVLQKTAQYIERPSFGAIASDLGNAVKKNPLGTMALGFGLGYLLRSTVFGGGQQAGQHEQPPAPDMTPAPTDTAATAYLDADLPPATSASVADLPTGTYGAGVATGAGHTDTYGTGVTTDTGAVDAYGADVATNSSAMDVPPEALADETLAVDADPLAPGALADDTLGAERDPLVFDATTEEPLTDADGNPLAGSGGPTPGARS